MEQYKEKILQICNEACKNTLMETLSIEFTDVGEDFLTARMPVDSRVHQPDGILHGGASVALAESVASAATFIFLDARKYAVRGIEISANHVRSIAEGAVWARATLLHKGRTTQLWEIRITNAEDQLISHCKLTTIALPKNG
ncbi:hotdog fold thioesterase [Robiginitalea sp. M366]|uniref:PaaI family thioesterase n=1 Tax=Robiginitalea aestuariiviva TaxID=3036903 RepID=UPI00240E02BC|nr:hotdog fold thioesterase [Robiginitalea aestuariiviva]MDG1573081.1 hotdog fold thioesterase [Robiginitalea aestuariiviva]